MEDWQPTDGISFFGPLRRAHADILQVVVAAGWFGGHEVERVGWPWTVTSLRPKTSQFLIRSVVFIAILEDPSGVQVVHVHLAGHWPCGDWPTLPLAHLSHELHKRSCATLQ